MGYMSYNQTTSSYPVDAYAKRSTLQPVGTLKSWYHGLLSGMFVLWEFHPRLTWSLIFSGYRSWTFDNQTTLFFDGFINKKNCTIVLQHSDSGTLLKWIGCHSILNNTHGILWVYMQEEIDKTHSLFITTHHKNFAFLLYPWLLLQNISPVISSEEWKCSNKKCSLFIDKDLISLSWSKIPSYISHKAHLDIWDNNILEIRDRNIDSGVLNGYIGNSEFELLYERWWLFKKHIQTKWQLNSSGFWLSLDIAKTLHWDGYLEHIGWNNLSGMMISSGGSSIRIW